MSLRACSTATVEEAAYKSYLYEQRVGFLMLATTLQGSHTSLEKLAARRAQIAHEDTPDAS